jgi:transposase
VLERASGALEEWISQAQATSWPALRQFAKGIADDQAAVMAALVRPESNGKQVEGHITQLKLIKRQMYERAKVVLLRQESCLLLFEHFSRSTSFLSFGSSVLVNGARCIQTAM